LYTITLTLNSTVGCFGVVKIQPSVSGAKEYYAYKALGRANHPLDFHLLLNAS